MASTPQGAQHSLHGLGKLFTVAEFANALRIREQTARNWIHEGRIKSLKVHGRRLISEAELVRLTQSAWNK